MALTKYSLRDIFNRIFNNTSSAIEVIINSQNQTVLTEITGVQETLSILWDSQAIAGSSTTQYTNSVDISNFRGCKFWVDVESLAAGSCSLVVEGSIDDGSNWDSLRFELNNATPTILSHTYNAGDETPIELVVRDFPGKVRLGLTPDGTNDVTATVRNIRIL